MALTLFGKSRIKFALCRPYSQYSKEFIEPIYNEEEQAKLFESGKAAILKHVPIKAPRSHETSSVYFDIVLAKFTNFIMQSGKKRLAREQLEKALTLIKHIQVERYNKAETEEEKYEIVTDPNRILYQAVMNCRPLLKLISVRRGGQTYQVPAPLSDTESMFRAMRWIVHTCRDKDGPIQFYFKLGHEILDAYNKKGRSYKQKTDLHKQCEANRAYAHYRWT